MTIGPGDMVAVGGKAFTVVEVRPNGKLRLSTGALVPAKGVTLIPPAQAAVIRQAETLRLERKTRAVVRDVGAALVVIEHLTRRRT